MPLLTVLRNARDPNGVPLDLVQIKTTDPALALQSPPLISGACASCNVPVACVLRLTVP